MPLVDDVALTYPRTVSPTLTVFAWFDNGIIKTLS